MASQQLSLQARRWRTIIVALPIIGATSYVLYQRLAQGKPRRLLLREGDATVHTQDAEKLASDVTKSHD